MSVARINTIVARVITALGLTALFCTAAVAEEMPLLGGGTLLLNSEPLQPVPLAQDLDPRLGAIGKRLFFDPRLSGDQQTHCGSCHQLPPVGENQPREGFSASMGRHNRSVPLLYNVGEYYWLNWDGGFSSLPQLIDAAIPAPAKMNAQWSEVLARLQGDYAAEFQRLNGRAMTREDLVAALTTFLRSLTTPNARFDRYLRGDRDALTAREQEGYRLFKDVGCASCHNGRSVGTNFFAQFYIYRHEGGEEGEPRLKDLGRFYVTGHNQDNNHFRVPSLRNVIMSGPYFHDGSSETLEHAIEEMSEHQLGVVLSRNEIDLLVDFLKTLTGNHPGVTP